MNHLVEMAAVIAAGYRAAESGADGEREPLSSRDLARFAVCDAVAILGEVKALTEQAVCERMAR